MAALRVLEWMERAPVQARVAAVAPLVRTLFTVRLSEEQRDSLDTTLTMLLDDPSVDVRRALAEALAVQEYAPRHLIVALSQDMPLVAEVVFRRSPCLIDSELIEAVGGGGERVQTAIATRPWISVNVSEALADEGCRAAVLAMLGNDGADLDEVAFRIIAGRFGDDGALREAMFARSDLPLAVRQSLIASLGAKLNLFLTSRSWMSEKRATAVVRDACDKATVHLAADADGEELADLVEHLRASGQLTTSLLIRSMCQGHVRLVEAALTRLTGLPSRRVCALLVDGRESALRALFTRAGLPERSHAAFVVALDVWRDLDFDGREGERPRYGRRMIERILTRYHNFAPGEVDDLMAMLRRLAAEAARETARHHAERRRAEAARQDQRVA